MMPLIVYLTNAVMSTLRKTHEIRKTWGELYVCEYRMIPVASVLSHVDDVRDRMALLCVSRIWRDVGTDAPGRWANCPRLLFEKPLARRLTARAVKRNRTTIHHHPRSCSSCFAVSSHHCGDCVTFNHFG